MSAPRTHTLALRALRELDPKRAGSTSSVFISNLKNANEKILARLASIDEINDKELSALLGEAGIYGLHNIFQYVFKNEHIRARLTPEILNHVFDVTLNPGVLRILIDNDCIPSKEQIISTIKTTLEADHRATTLVLLSLSTQKKWNMSFDFHIKDMSPLAYAIDINDPVLLEAFLQCGMSTEELSHLNEEKTPYNELMTTVVSHVIAGSQLKQYWVDQDSFKILVLLIKAGANIYCASCSSLIGIMCDSTVVYDFDPAFYSLSAESPEKYVTSSDVVDYILSLLIKDLDRFQKELAEIFISANFYEKYPKVAEKIFSRVGREMIQYRIDKLPEMICTIRQSGKPYVGWLNLLVTHGFDLSLLAKHIIKNKTETSSNVNQFDRPLGSGDFELGINFLRDKLQQKYIPNKDLCLNLEFITQLFSEILESKEIAAENAKKGRSKEEIEASICLLIASGARTPVKQYINILKKFFNLSNFDHPAIDILCFYAAKNNLKMVDLMLDMNVTFNDEYSRASLQKAIENAEPDLAKKLQAVLAKERSIEKARQDFIFQKNTFKEKMTTDENPEKKKDWLEHQNELRPKLIRAIGKFDVNKVIELVSQGADPNFAGEWFQHGDPKFVGMWMRDDYVNVGSAVYNAKGMTPLHFTCFVLEGKKAVEMFQLLQDLGADVGLANQHAEFLFQRKLSEIFKKSPNEKLVHVIEQAELKAKNKALEKIRNNASGTGAQNSSSFASLNPSLFQSRNAQMDAGDSKSNDKRPKTK